MAERVGFETTLLKQGPLIPKHLLSARPDFSLVKGLFLRRFAATLTFQTVRCSEQCCNEHPPVTSPGTQAARSTAKNCCNRKR
jgi:hypothetical protein